jgi:hypothetical protein
MSANARLRMIVMTARIERDALAAFDALAVARGGRGALLRQLIDRALQEGGSTARIDPPEGPARNRISLRFTEVENVVIAHRAAERSTDRSGWIKALVRRHLALKARVDDGLLAELAPIRMQLLRIGRNVNQAMKAANTAMLPDGDKGIEPHLQSIVDMRMEISEQVAAIGDAMRGDVAYWTVAD